MNIGGNIVSSLIGKLNTGGGSGAAGGPPSFNRSKYGGRAFNYQTDNSGNVVGGTPPPPDYWNSAGQGGDRNVGILINGILKKYGFNNLRF